MAYRAAVDDDGRPAAEPVNAESTAFRTTASW
jgi:hypothetical protein